MKRLTLCLAFVAYASSADAACRLYSVWRYPFPQPCGGIHAEQRRDPPDAPLPPEKDERTPADIRDQAEHDAAVQAHHSELNFLLEILKREEEEESK